MSERFGDFELLSLLSADTALESYLALPPGGGAQVVLRRLRLSVASQPGARDTFLQDAQGAMQLQHPSVARVVAVGEVAHQPYLAQEHIEGSSLEALIRRARGTASWPLPLPQALALFAPVLEGLAAAHARTPSVLHREVSPRNVFVTPDGRAVLGSFGLARTRRSAGLGIADPFLSPEQMHGQPLAAPSDVFTAGLMLFELACGRLPAEGTTGEIVARIGSGDLEGALAVRADAGPLAALLSKALHPDRAQRFADAKAFTDGLKALALPTASPADVAQWVATLPAGAAPVPPVVPVAADAPAPAARGTVPNAAAAAAPLAAPPPRRLGLMARLGLGVLLVLSVAELGFDLSGLIGARLAPVEQAIAAPQLPATFETEIGSKPPQANLRIDGQSVGKTPFRFTSERDRVYQVSVDSSDGSIDLVVQNVTLVELDLVEQRVVKEVRLAGSRPPPKEKEKAAAKPDLAATAVKAKVAATFRATAPTRFMLETAHQVRIDDAPQLQRVAANLRELAPGYRTGGPSVAQRQGAGINLNRPVPPRGLTPSQAAMINADAQRSRLAPFQNNMFKHLSMVLSRQPDSLVLSPVAPGPVAVPAVPSWAFVLSERTMNATEVAPTFEYADRTLNLTTAPVVLVEGDNRFNVDGLAEAGQWKVTVSVIAKAGTVPASAVLKVTPISATVPATLDGVQVETATIVVDPVSTHTISGASKAWLAVPTVSGVEASPLEVTFEVF